ncbi:AAA domain-containing protein [Laspinema olomoucense]|uniref:AAA domain-containing protein n=1 Tax=Laspinema olomoucense TaxID=3231600 RepID=UPI0021BB708F|nr:AAA domain-containing protein [Laspinema sp. D3d]MCT7972491.1 AAA domain-containing protein [Laspinema sp. D3d]
MPSIEADPTNFAELLEIVRDGYEISLKPGDYKGTFTIARAVTIRGSGGDAVLFAVDAPAVVVTVAGVRLENLAIARTVGGETGAVAVRGEANTAPILHQVRLTGSAENVQWEGAIWEIPARLEFGEIEPNRQVEKAWELQLGESCQVVSDLDWLQVRSQYLSPGLQWLQMAVNSQGIPAGTRLSGSVYLCSQGDKREIQVTAEIITRVEWVTTVVPSEKSATAKQEEAKWGYRLVGKTAIANVIRELAGEKPSDRDEDFRSRRDRAELLFSQLLEQRSHSFYLRRLGTGKDAGEERWQLTLACDREEPGISLLEKRYKTLSLIAVVSPDGRGGLRLIDVIFVPQTRGRGDGFTVLCRLRLLPDHQYDLGVPRSALKRMAKLPVSGDLIPTEEQLQAWRVYVEIERRIAESRQFCVPFIAHNYGADTRRISFELDSGEATIDGSSETGLAAAEFWSRTYKARSEQLRLFESSPLGKSGRDGRILGRIDSVDAERRLIRIKPDADLLELMKGGYYQLPETGYLLFEAFGELSQINHKMTALKRLEQGHSQNPYLGQFFFDAGQARVPKQTIKLERAELLLPAANPDQIAAVEMVLSAKDLVLIQGPPGTGKTTVIAEICYQVARRGGRTLIASQANLAVDNALSRLVHSPVVRALRKGKAEKVQEEGAPYLEENAIGTWLQNTASHCETDLEKRRNDLVFYHKMRDLAAEFARYLAAEEALASDRLFWKERQEILLENRAIWEQQYQAAQAQNPEVKRVSSDLAALLATAPNVPWESPEVVNLLAQIRPYTLENSTVKTFIDAVRVALPLTQELGWIRPDRGAFGLAAWCCETVAPELAKWREVVTEANHTAEAIVAAATAVQQFRADSTPLHQLQGEYEQALNKQKSLQQRFQNLQNRKLEIDRVIKEVGVWLETAPAQVYTLLKQSLQTGRTFNSNLIQVPNSLLRIAQTLNVVIMPNYGDHPVSDLPNWEQFLKALAYETKGNFRNSKGNHSYFHEFLHRSLNQPPIVFSASDRTLWRDLAAGYSNYPNLTTSGRQNLVVKTQEVLQQQQQQYATIWEVQAVELTLQEIAQTTIDEIVTQARQCLLPLKTETEQGLSHIGQQWHQIQHWIAAQKPQLEQSQAALDLLRQAGEKSLQQAVEQLQQLSQQPHLPPAILTAVQRYQANRALIWEKPSEFAAMVQSWENRITNLETAIAALAPFEILGHIHTLIEAYLTQQQQNLQPLQQQLEQCELELHEIKQQLTTNLPELLLQKRQWWQKTWETLRDRLPQIAEEHCCDLPFLHQVRTQFETWEQAGNQEEQYLNRYQNLVQDWIDKLRHPSEQDRTELRQIYLDNANVIGITCVQAARRDFSEEFNKFDVVIIDEVSKCTPPELLIPALKAKRLVLVGDRCQLPPMLNDDTIEDIAIEMGSSKEALQFLEDSFFKLQFDAAPESIKTMLTIQYRMHPNIMGAINQFYDRRLQCGILDPDQARKHHLNSTIIQEHQHLIWVKMPQDSTFGERKEGTSFINPKEIEAIEQLCQNMENTWSEKIAQGHPPKEIGIITFYRAQLNRIEEKILESNRFPSLQIRTGTVDQFQGMERSVIIVSMVRNNTEGKVGFAKKSERVNVAFSRARELLVIVGCHELFAHHHGEIGRIYSEVSNVVRHQGGLIDVSRILR